MVVVTETMDKGVEENRFYRGGLQQVINDKLLSDDRNKG